MKYIYLFSILIRQSGCYEIYKSAAIFEIKMSHSYGAVQFTSTGNSVTWFVNVAKEKGAAGGSEEDPYYPSMVSV